MKKKNIKILSAISGGVDSSVATALLVKAGYDVTCAFMVNYEDKDSVVSCWRGDYQDALRVCAKLGIPLLRLNFVKEYKKEVLDFMYKEYQSGRTPNPDVLCNKFIKFGAWIKKAEELGFDFLATGHYASLNKKYQLLESKDKNKDQTYFLHQVNKKQLEKVLFPLGKYTKKEVRGLAKKFNLPTANKEESMGICFVGEVPMKKFLQKKIKIKKGSIIMDKEVVGKHDGVAFYTIGQRIGINFDLNKNKKNNTKPIYVVEKNIKKNELIVAFEDSPLLFKKEIKVGGLNWITRDAPKLPLKCKVRLRHRQPMQDCVICNSKEFDKVGYLIVKFKKLQRAVTPGQYTVFYLKGVCLGGGVII